MALLSQGPLKVASYKAHWVERSGERAFIGPVEKYLDRGGWDMPLGSYIEEELDLIRHEAMYRLHAYGSKVSFWRDLDRYLDELISMFPKEEKGIRAL